MPLVLATSSLTAIRMTARDSETRIPAKILGIAAGRTMRHKRAYGGSRNARGAPNHQSERYAHEHGQGPAAQQPAKAWKYVLKYAVAEKKSDRWTREPKRDRASQDFRRRREENRPDMLCRVLPEKNEN